MVLSTLMMFAMLVAPTLADWGDLHMRGTRGDPVAARR